MQQKKIGVLISGSGSNLQSLIDTVKKGFINAEISIVISNRENAYGLQRASESGIENVFVSKKACGNNEAFNDKIIDILTEKKVDLVVLAGYLNILTTDFISAFKNRIINIHPALIPSFCGNGFYGLKVHEAALNYGVKISGATVHFVDNGTDTGPVILQDTVAVKDNDTPETLQKRILTVEHKLLPLAVKLFCEDKITVIEEIGKRSIVKIHD